MKKVLVIVIILLLISQPVTAFSIRDVLNDFKIIFIKFFNKDLMTGSIIKTCSDGTLYGECSINKPWYCNSGLLKENCGLCGCNEGYICISSTNKCELTIQKCSDGTPYNSCSITKPQYCSSGVLIDKCSLCGCDTGYECNIAIDKCDLIQTYSNCGTILHGSCESNGKYCYDGVLIDKCSICRCDTNYMCNIPTDKCIINSTLQQCSDGTSYNSCSITKPLYCSNGNLINKCNICGCNTGYECNVATDKCELIQTYSNCGTILHDACDNNHNYCYNGNLEFNCNECGCNTGFICQNNACVKEVECETNNDCNTGYKCDNKICVEEILDVECNTDADCNIGYKCKNNECKELIIIIEGSETNNTEILNRIPIIFAIGDQTIKVGEIFEVKINAMDPERRNLDYYFENGNLTISIGIVHCSISENILTCNGVREGDMTLNIIVSDGVNEEIATVRIQVIPGTLVGNHPPVADAGSDIMGIPEKNIILDGSKSYDTDKDSLTYGWYENDNLIGDEKVIRKKFSSGNYKIKLMVTDINKASNEDIINVKIKDKKICKETNVIYYPDDTICENKWPNGNGKEIQINSPGESCNIFEVCSDKLDYLIEEAIECCTTDNTIENPRKAAACSFAKEFTQNSKDCGAFYLIKTFGGLAAGPMTSYFNAEMCCKGVKKLCPNENFLYKPEPLPEYLKGVKCSNTPLNSPYGKWVSNVDLNKNEIALFDAPASVSVKEIKSGTCADYSITLTTLLRKIGFKENEVYTAESFDHVYNLIKFEDYAKYHIFDTTGNYEGFVLGNVPTDYDYCGELLRCYNDNGEVICPPNRFIIGCEDVKEKIGRSSVKILSGIRSGISDIIKKFEKEIKR